MKYLETIEDREAVVTLSTDVDFDQFIERMLSLDASTYNKIYDDKEERAKFCKMSSQEKLTYFSHDFQNQIRDLYQNFCSQKKITHSLALGVYRLAHVTGASYKDIAEHLELALQKQFSKSYISKLFRVGKLLTVAPDLAVVLDTEKLAELSRIPAEKIVTLVERTDDGIVRVSNCDVANASRAKIQEIVQQEVPVSSKKSSSKLAPIVPQASVGKQGGTLKNLREQLSESLLFIDRSDLRAAIENCIRIIDGENQ